MNGHDLTPEQNVMVEMWERHMAAEFEAKSIDATMATMTSDPFVNHVPVMTGGVGYSEVRHFYSTYFIPGHPPDTEVVPVTRTVGRDRVVDELIHKFTHTVEMPWILPGIPPTGKRVEVAVVVVVQLEHGKIAGERIYLGPGLRARSGRLDGCTETARDGDRGLAKGRRSRPGTVQHFDQEGDRVPKMSIGIRQMH